jgi:hypothetical protein
MQGKVMSWGSGQNGEFSGCDLLPYIESSLFIGKLGHGGEENVTVPCYIPSLENIKTTFIAAGCEHSAIITDSGALYTWGHGDGGRLGHGDGAQCPLPTCVKALEMMNLVPQEVHCGDKFTVVLVKCLVKSDKRDEVVRNVQESLSHSRSFVSAARSELAESPVKYSNSWFREELRRFREDVSSSSSSRNQVRDADTVQITSNTVDIGRPAEAPTSAKQLSGSQGCQLLLSLVATECDFLESKLEKETVTTIDVSKQELPINTITDKAFAVECSTSTFAHLLCLLEMHTELLCLSVDAVKREDRQNQDNSSSSSLLAGFGGPQMLNLSPSPALQSPTVSMIDSFGGSQTFPFGDGVGSRVQQDQHQQQFTALVGKRYEWLEDKDDYLDGSAQCLVASASYLHSLLSILSVNLTMLNKVVSVSNPSKDPIITGSKLDLITSSSGSIGVMKPLSRKEGPNAHHHFTGFRRFIDGGGPSNINSNTELGYNNDVESSRFYEGRDEEGNSEDGMEYTTEDSEEEEEEEEVVAYENMDGYDSHNHHNHGHHHSHHQHEHQHDHNEQQQSDDVSSGMSYFDMMRAGGTGGGNNNADNLNSSKDTDDDHGHITAFASNNNNSSNSQTAQRPANVDFEAMLMMDGDEGLDYHEREEHHQLNSSMNDSLSLNNNNTVDGYRVVDEDESGGPLSPDLLQRIFNSNSESKSQVKRTESNNNADAKDASEATDHHHHQQQASHGTNDDIGNQHNNMNDSINSTFGPRHSPNPSNESLASNESFEDAAIDAGDFNTFSYFHEFEEEQEDGDMVEFQTAIMRSMEDMANDAAYEEFSMPLRACLSEPQCILPRIREALESVAVKSFCTFNLYQCFDNSDYFPNSDYAANETAENQNNSSGSATMHGISSSVSVESSLVLTSLWLEVQGAVGKGFNVLYQLSTQQLFLEKLLHSPSSQLPLLPGIVAGLCVRTNNFRLIKLFEFKVADVTAAFQFVRNNLLCCSSQLNVVRDYILNLIGSNNEGKAGFQSKQQLYRCHRLVCKSYYYFLRMLLAFVLTTFFDKESGSQSFSKNDDSISDWTTEQLSLLLAEIIACVEEELTWLCRAEVIEIRRRDRVEELLSGSFTSYFVGFLSSFFASRRSMWSASVYLSAACQLTKIYQRMLGSLARVSLRADNENVLMLQVFLEKKVKWTYLFLATTMQIMSAPKLEQSATPLGLQRSSKPRVVCGSTGITACAVVLIDGIKVLLDMKKHLPDEDRQFLSASDAVFANYNLGDSSLLKASQPPLDEISAGAAVARDCDSPQMHKRFRMLRDIVVSTDLKNCANSPWLTDIIGSGVACNYFQSEFGPDCDSITFSELDRGIQKLHVSLFFCIMKGLGGMISNIIHELDAMESVDASFLASLPPDSPIMLLLCSWLLSIELSGSVIALLIKISCGADVASIISVVETSVADYSQLWKYSCNRIDCTALIKSVHVLATTCKESTDPHLQAVKIYLRHFFDGLHQTINLKLSTAMDSSSFPLKLTATSVLERTISNISEEQDLAWSFLVALVQYMFIGCSAEYLVSRAMRNEIINRCKVASLMICSLALETAVESSSIQKYFCESIGNEFEGSENILDWIHLPSWNSELNHAAMADHLENTVSKGCARLLYHAYDDLDKAVLRSLQKVDFLPSAKDYTESIVVHMFQLVGCLRLGWHCYSNFSFAVFPSERQQWEPRSATEVVTRFAAIPADANALNSGSKQSKSSGCNRYIQLLECCLHVIELAYHFRRVPTANPPRGSLSVHTLSEVMSNLKMRLTDRINQYQNLLQVSKCNSVSFLLPSTKDLLSTSPTIIPSIFTSNGQYAIGFWIKIAGGFKPEMGSTKEPTDKRNKTSIHVLSRIPETSDFNLLSLVNNEASFGADGDRLDTNNVVSPCNPNIFLEWDDVGCKIVAVISVTNPPAQSSNSNSSVRPSISSCKVCSDYLPRDEWVLVSLQHTQRAHAEFVANTAKRATSLFFSERNSRRVKRTEKCAVELHINNQKQGEATFTGGLFQPYQTVIIGTVPTVLDNSQNSSGVGSSERSKAGVLLSGVFWTSSNYNPPANVTSLATTKSINEALFQLLNRAPPSIVQEEILDLWAASGKIMDVTSQIMQHSMNTTLKPPGEGPNESLSTILLFGFAMVCLGDERVVDSALKCLATVLNVVGDLNLPEKSMQKQTASGVILHLLSLVGDMVSGKDDFAGYLEAYSFASTDGVGSSTDMSAILHVRDIWKQRLQFSHKKSDKKTGQDQSLESSLRFCLNENMLVTGIAGILTSQLRSGKLVLPDTVSAGSDATELWNFLCSLCGGGWPTMTAINRVVEVIPRALFLASDPKGLEQVLFPTSASVMHVSYARPGIWLRNCMGSFARIASANTTVGLEDVLIPRSPLTILPSTEMITTRDPFELISLEYLLSGLASFAIPDIHQLGSILHDVVVSPTISSPNYTASESVDVAQVDAIKSSNKLIQIMSFLRCMLCQLAAMTGLSVGGRMEQLKRFLGLLTKNMRNIATIAATDPVLAVTKAFDSGAYKGAQLDVLRNLLKEGDVCFLEKISLRVWRDAKISVTRGLLAKDVALANRIKEIDEGNILCMIPIAGDVQIIGSKIRAIAHFPTVKLPNVALDKMTGRWFYECILLSDGLMQIGWASPLFRCDPSCGQGTGDHVSSWAFDGLRSKKWNVSCEPYGKRWRQGDVIGVLADMDLQEMRYFINGEDLGAAFVSFATNELFPALSLNVRQSVRVNFGQYKFVHPPDEFDGKSYRSIRDYFVMQASVQINTPERTIGPTKPSGTDSFSGSDVGERPPDAAETVRISNAMISPSSTGTNNDRLETSSALSNPSTRAAGRDEMGMGIATPVELPMTLSPSPMTTITAPGTLDSGLGGHDLIARMDTDATDIREVSCLCAVFVFRLYSRCCYFTERRILARLQR